MQYVKIWWAKRSPEWTGKVLQESERQLSQRRSCTVL